MNQGHVALGPPSVVDSHFHGVCAQPCETRWNAQLGLRAPQNLPVLSPGLPNINKASPRRLGTRWAGSTVRENAGIIRFPWIHWLSSPHLAPYKVVDSINLKLHHSSVCTQAPKIVPGMGCESGSVPWLELQSPCYNPRGMVWRVVSQRAYTEHRRPIE